MGRLVGIDLGTTNSIIAAITDGKPTVIRGHGTGVTPSIISFEDSGSLLVGESAKNQAVLSPTKTISSSKRFIGKTLNEVSIEIERAAFKVEETESKGIAFDIGSRKITPEEVGAFILRHLVDLAAEELGEEITDAIITVPAYFTDAQRKATENAGKLAGLTVKRILNEPTAAALAFGLTHKEGGKVMVFDLGGGTFDVSLLEVGDNVWEVLATAGDNHLGGDDFDQKLLEWALVESQKILNIDLKTMPQALQRLKVAVEEAKCTLSIVESTTINLPFLVSDNGKGGHLNLTITREIFDEVTSELVEKCKAPFLQVLSDSGLTANDIDEVLLVGGSTRIPAVRKLIRDLSDGKEPNTSVNPEEVVALGAAVQAGILSGTIEQMVLLDVTPFSLGVLTGTDGVASVIPRNTPLPTRKSEYFSTGEHFQRGVDIVIVQGESRSATSNNELGRFALEGLSKQVKGDALIEICFELNENGILNVAAKDVHTGRETSIEIKTIGNLARKEIEKMKLESNQVFESTKAKREVEELFAKTEYLKERLSAFVQANGNENKQIKIILGELEKSLDKGGKPAKLRDLCGKAEALLGQVG
jgi:molecular chaperone DnaK